MDDSPGGKCDPVIGFECMDLSIGQRVNVSRLSLCFEQGTRVLG